MLDVFGCEGKRGWKNEKKGVVVEIIGVVN